jgi:hypothetical protein
MAPEKALHDSVKVKPKCSENPKKLEKLGTWNVCQGKPQPMRGPSPRLRTVSDIGLKLPRTAEAHICTMCPVLWTWSYKL